LHSRSCFRVKRRSERAELQGIRSGVNPQELLQVVPHLVSKRRQILGLSQPDNLGLRLVFADGYPGPQPFLADGDEKKFLDFL